MTDPTATPTPLHCSACGHAWTPVVYLPMPVTDWCRWLQGQSICPRCGKSGGNVLMGERKVPA